MAAKKQNPEDYWRKVVNSLRGPFPEVGAGPPVDEVVSVHEVVSEKPQVDPALTGNLSRITMDIYFFLDPKTNKYFTMQNQTMVDFGEVTLGEAAEMVRKRKRKTKD